MHDSDKRALIQRLRLAAVEAAHSGHETADSTKRQFFRGLSEHLVSLATRVEETMSPPHRDDAAQQAHGMARDRDYAEHMKALQFAVLTSSLSSADYA